ncbi:MAG: HAD family phosphatase [Verrucomicrobia bacterium]|nr:HAD family phosphatase [Verrucomicrobiota bacterium]
MNSVPWAAIFDWDGVIIDSSKQHEESWKRYAAGAGLYLPDGYFKQGFGMKNEVIIPRILKWAMNEGEIATIAKGKEDLYREIVREEGIQTIGGVREFLDHIRRHGVPCAIGSSTCLANIECVLDTIGLRDHFDQIVSAEDVTHGKPEPEVFLLAAEKLNMEASRCVVFEDAQVGVDAGIAAGMCVVGVASTHPEGSLRGVKTTVTRLDELKSGEIEAWFE